MSNLYAVKTLQLGKYISNLWIKPVCLLCQQSLSQYQRICQDCVTQIPFIMNACHLCAQPLVEGQTSCGACQKDPPPYDRLWVALDYAAPIDKLVLGGKFSRRLSDLELLADLFMRYWHTQQPIKPEVLIPVPLHAKRLRERGYNQALELTKAIAKPLQVPIDFLSLQLSKTTLAQAGLYSKPLHKNLNKGFILNLLFLIRFSSVSISYS